MPLRAGETHRLQGIRLGAADAARARQASPKATVEPSRETLY